MSISNYKEDIKLMLNKLTKMIDNDYDNYESLISNIYNDLDTLSPIDIFVTREYVKDSIESILASQSIVSEDKQHVVCKGEDGVTYIINPADGTATKVEKTNNTFNINSDTVVAAPVDENNEQQPEQPMDNENDETEMPNNDQLQDESENPTITEMDSVIEDANKLLDSINDSIGVAEPDTIASLIITQTGIEEKIKAIQNEDPNSENLPKMIDSLKALLNDVETNTIDTLVKNTDGVDANATPAKDAQEKIEQIENSNTQDVEQNESNEQNEKTEPVQSSFEIEESESLMGEKDSKEDDVKTLYKEESIDAPDAEEISESLGDGTEEDIDIDIDSETDMSEDDSEINFEDKSEELPEDVSDEEYINTELNDVRQLVDELLNLAKENVPEEEMDKVKELENLLNEEIDEIDEKNGTQTDDEGAEVVEEVEDEELPENEEIEDDFVKENKLEFDDNLDELNEEEIPEEFSSETVDEEKSIKENEQINSKSDPLCLDTLFEEDNFEEDNVLEEDIDKNYKKANLANNDQKRILGEDLTPEELTANSLGTENKVAQFASTIHDMEDIEGVTEEEADDMVDNLYVSDDEITVENELPTFEDDYNNLNRISMDMDDASKIEESPVEKMADKIIDKITEKVVNKIDNNCVDNCVSNECCGNNCEKDLSPKTSNGELPYNLVGSKKKVSPKTANNKVDKSKSVKITRSKKK